MDDKLPSYDAAAIAGQRFVVALVWDYFVPRFEIDIVLNGYVSSFGSHHGDG